jgi:NADPH:quinone reductase-like Zn-dependent oxidoreductase
VQHKERRTGAVAGRRPGHRLYEKGPVVGGENYDVIFDAVGKTSLEACRKALAPEGTFLTVQKGLAKGSPEDLNTLKELVEAGALRPVIDRRYPLEQAAEAHRYVEAGHKAGNVVLTVRNG